MTGNHLYKISNMNSIQIRKSTIAFSVGINIYLSLLTINKNVKKLSKTKRIRYFLRIEVLST